MRKSATRVLLATVFQIFALTLAPGLSAGEKRGANVIITRIDGDEVRGELVAVKPDSFLLLSDGAGVTVGLADIRSVRVIRRSRALPLAIGGFVAGGAIGAYAVSRDNEDRNTGTTLLGAGGFGAVGALIGTGLGLAFGMDAVIPIAGESDAVVARSLDQLKGYSREGRVTVRAAPRLTMPLTGRPAGSAARAPSRRPRFRLSMGMTTAFGRNEDRILQNFVCPWRFLGSVPPGESGPFTAPFFHSSHAGTRSWIAAGPIGLAYELTETWLPEIEVYLPRKEIHGVWGDLRFTSTADGRIYQSRVGDERHVDFSSVLIGLNYRPLTPSPLERTSVEFGISAGPAMVKVTPGRGPVRIEPFGLSGQKIVLSARVHAAYDFYFVPAFSLGAVVAFRYLQATYPAMTGAIDATFYDYGVEPFTRQVEVDIPALKVDETGLTAGLRIGFRF